MKRQLIIFAITALAAILASCSREEVLTETSDSKEISFSVTEIGTESRAGNTTDNLSNFGISISNPVCSQYTYNNIKVEKSSSDDKWTPAEQMLWHNLTDTVDIVACAPYASTAGNLCGVSNYAVSVDKDQSKGISNSDFLVFKKTALVPKTDLNIDGTLGVTFEHAMCKLNIKITFNYSGDKQLSENPISRLEVCGTKLNGTCDFTTAKPKVVEGGQTGNLEAYCDSFTAQTENDLAKAQYSCILIPQNISQSKLSIKISTKTSNYNWTLSNSTKIEGGKSYILNLSFDGNSISKKK